MEIQMWQIIALTILSMILIWDSLSTAIFDGKPMFAGILAGIIMGDITTGLAVGATLQLMVLGVGTYGGSSMPPTPPVMSSSRHWKKSSATVRTSIFSRIISRWI